MVAGEEDGESSLFAMVGLGASRTRTLAIIEEAGGQDGQIFTERSFGLAMETWIARYASL